MKNLPKNRSLQYFLTELIFTEAALSADPFAATLAAACSMLINGWFALLKKERESRHDVTRAGAVVRVKNQMLDMIIRKFAGLVLVEANQDRESVFYRRFFPNSPSSIAKQAISKQVDFISNALVPEIDRLEEGHPLKAFRDTLLKAAEEATGTVEAKKRARGTRTSISRDVEEWKIEVNAFRMNALGELLKIASANGYPRTWADSFFRTEPTSYEIVDEEASSDKESEVIETADTAEETAVSAVAA